MLNHLKYSLVLMKTSILGDLDNSGCLFEKRFRALFNHLYIFKFEHNKILKECFSSFVISEVLNFFAVKLRESSDIEQSAKETKL